MIDARTSPALIIGTGLVGASVGCALVAAGVEVHLRDATPSHALVAGSRGAGTIDPVEPLDCNLVVVAVPPAHLAEVIAAALAEFPSATVTDVGSVKGAVLADLRARGLDLGRYCGSHPMAGSQHTGPLTARADLFTDRTWIITPHDTSSAQAVLAVQHMARACGARLVTMAAGPTPPAATRRPRCGATGWWPGPARPRSAGSRARSPPARPGHGAPGRCCRPRAGSAPPSGG